MLKVLIAEDELLIADQLEEALVASGYEVCGIARTVDDAVVLVIRVIRERRATGAILTIRDDGIGFVQPASSKRHGLGLVRRLMEQIGGAVRLGSDRGTKWTLAFPRPPKDCCRK